MLLYVIVTEGADWPARIEYLETKHPKAARWLHRHAEKKWLRFVLLFVAIMLLGRNILELREKHPEDQKQCWHYAAWGQVPDSAAKLGAEFADVVTVVCNYDVDHPIVWDLEFDQPIITYGSWVIGENFYVGGATIDGNHLKGAMGNDLRARHLLQLTVYTKEQPSLVNFKFGNLP